ncbi:MAG: DUF3131 domain-containing protein [Pseudomonadota bacterium]
MKLMSRAIGSTIALVIVGTLALYLLGRSEQYRPADRSALIQSLDPSQTSARIEAAQTMTSASLRDEQVGSDWRNARNLRENWSPQMLSSVTGVHPVQKPARLCEMENEPQGPWRMPRVGYTEDHTYVRSYRARRGFLTEKELQAAQMAWSFFEKHTQESTGLANSVGTYPSTTMWDTASYISGLVSAYELCIIEKAEFDKRILKLLSTMRRMALFRGELPNKAYQTKTAERVNYQNVPGEIGFSSLDIGRLLVWFRILSNRYPYLSNSIDSILLRWDFSNVIGDDGLLYGARLDEESGQIVYTQEGRLGYEEYAAKGFALWGFEPHEAHRAEPFTTVSIFDTAVPYDARDPRVFHTRNYVVTESYLLDGLEMNWDLPHDDTSPDWIHTDGWRADFADRVYHVQAERFRKVGYLTARSEHNVKGSPYFVYDSIFSDGFAWNTMTPRGEYAPEHAAISTKAAFGLWSLWETEYTDHLLEAVINLGDPELGFYEGMYEEGTGFIPLQTSNNNGILLAALLHKVQGKLLTPDPTPHDLWYTKFREGDIRVVKSLPDPPSVSTWLMSDQYPETSLKQVQK